MLGRMAMLSYPGHILGVEDTPAFAGILTRGAEVSISVSKYIPGISS